MTTWSRGRELLRIQLMQNAVRLDAFLEKLKEKPPIRVPGTAVFLTATAPMVPTILPHHLEHNQVLHEQVVLLTVVTEDVPRVGAQDRLTIELMRSEARSVGKECVRTCRSRWSPTH